MALARAAGPTTPTRELAAMSHVHTTAAMAAARERRSCQLGLGESEFFIIAMFHKYSLAAG